MIEIYTQRSPGEAWLSRHQGKVPAFVCILGFTETGCLPEISAAGATPAARRTTAIADAEYLLNGPQPRPDYPLPPLQDGVSPVLITRALMRSLSVPITLVNAGLSQAPPVPAIDLGGVPANCVTTGQALPLPLVERLFYRGLAEGDRLGRRYRKRYLIISECVVGGTTTAQAILTGLGFEASGKVSSSHPHCNHEQKAKVVQQGLQAAGWSASDNPLALVAAVGDPMQIVAAGMAIAASHCGGVLLAGGTQMLAIYALIKALVQFHSLKYQPEQIVVGTTRWVAEDPSGDTVGLAQEVSDVPLLATQLSFAQSRFPQLQVYEQGYVKEGVGAGASAIAAHLAQRYDQAQLLALIEAELKQFKASRDSLAVDPTL